MKTILGIIIIAISFCACNSNPAIANGNYTKKIDGLAIHFTVKGSGPVMLVGHPNSGKIGYELTLQPLEQKFTMVYYDARGTGKSATPLKISDYAPQYSVKEIAALQKAIGAEKIWLFGHSDQSAIALQYAVKYPNRVAGLILSGTSWVGTQSESIERRKLFENKRSRQSQWFAKVVSDWDYMIANHTKTNKNGNDLSDVPLKWWTYNEESFQKVKPIVKEIARAGRRKPIANEMYQETPKERNQYLAIQNQFKNLNTKILIINGQYDTNNPPEYAEELQHHLRNSKLVLINKAGHFPWIEEKNQTFDIINQWLCE